MSASQPSWICCLALVYFHSCQVCRGYKVYWKVELLHLLYYMATHCHQVTIILLKIYLRPGLFKTVLALNLSSALCQLDLTDGFNVKKNEHQV
jgi:hypothetical protein